jgi:hypothetical protein
MRALTLTDLKVTARGEGVKLHAIPLNLALPLENLSQFWTIYYHRHLIRTTSTNYLN